jgi:four helix bundle protein
MHDRLEDIEFYKIALTLFDDCWEDSSSLLSDIREVAKQLTRSIGSISANIEEGYGRGFGKEYSHF